MRKKMKDCMQLVKAHSGDGNGLKAKSRSRAPSQNDGYLGKYAVSKCSLQARQRSYRKAKVQLHGMRHWTLCG
jgi:hypothetical protein